VTSTPLFHTPGSIATDLEAGTPLRALDQGRSKPILCRLERSGTRELWVVKAASSDRRGGASLICEVAASDIAVHLGLLAPAVGTLQLPEPVDRTLTSEVDERFNQLCRANGRRAAFCSRFIDGAVSVVDGFFGDLRSVPNEMQSEAIRVFALDVLLRHYDRTPKNPNLLTMEDRLVVIDHGVSFHGVEAINEDGLSKYEDADGDALGLARHVCAPLVARNKHSTVFDEAEEAVASLSDSVIAGFASAWPNSLEVGPDGTSSGMRTCIVRALRARRDKFPSILRSVRDCLAR
jgi:hypothetical protein